MESSKSPPIYKGLPTIPMDPDSMLLPGNSINLYRLFGDPEQVKEYMEYYKLDDGCSVFLVISERIKLSGNNEKLKGSKGVLCRFAYKEGKTAALIGQAVAQIVGFSTSSDSVFRVDVQVIPDKDCSEYFAKNREVARKKLQEVAGNLRIIIRRSTRFNKAYKNLKFRIIPESLKSVAIGIDKISIDDEDFIAEVSDAINEAIYCLPVVLKHEKQKFIDLDFLPDRLDLCRFIVSQKTLFIDQLITLREEKNSINAFVAMFSGSNSSGESADLDENRFGPEYPDSVRNLWSKYLGKRDKIPTSVQEIILAEFARFKNSSNSHTSMSSDQFLERLRDIIEMPWGVMDPTNTDIKGVKNILDESHEGLPKQKQIVLEYVAPIIIDPNTKAAGGQILCFIGPAGVGKTSLAESIAKALGRKYERITLGGARDGSKIKGHRVTFVSSVKGEIASALRRLGTMNPVILLDEIDKTSIQGNRDDIGAALLEALDPDHNHGFKDEYLDCDVDLSNVFFICAANTLEEIPFTLFNRMKRVPFAGYTDYQKVRIAKKICGRWQDKLPFEKLNLRVAIEEEAILSIINEYTQEAGVRRLDQEIERIYRSVFMKHSELPIPENEQVSQIKKSDLQKILGIPKYTHDKFDEPRIGEITGLAWTEFGGETMRVQGLLIGEGRDKEISQTGGQGETMREGNKVAVSIIRNRLRNEGKEFNECIHIHVGATAVKKDGPSAGITVLCSSWSAIKKLKPRKNITLTGEIDLQERVLAIGGVQEKVLAAKRKGITHIILPEENRRNIEGEEVEKEVLEGVTFYYAQTVEEVFKIVFPDYRPA